MAIGGHKRPVPGGIDKKIKGEPTRKQSDRHEDKTAKQFGGKKQRGSGSTPYNKADVKSRNFLFENKSTKHASMSVKAEWLEKVTKQARAIGRDPAIDIEILGVKDSQTENRWVMVPASVFAAMQEE